MLARETEYFSPRVSSIQALSTDLDNHSSILSYTFLYHIIRSTKQLPHKMSTPLPPPSPKAVFPFLKLPGELRNKIYGYILPENKLLRFQLCCPNDPHSIQLGCTNHRVKTLHDTDHRPSTAFPLKDVCKALRLETEHIAIEESTVEIYCRKSQHPLDGDWIPTISHTLNFPVHWLRRVVLISPWNGTKLDDFDIDSLRRELNPIAKLCDRLPKANVKYVFDFGGAWRHDKEVPLEEALAMLKAGVLVFWLFRGYDHYRCYFPDHPTWRTRVVGVQGLPKTASIEDTALREADRLCVAFFPEWELDLDKGFDRFITDLYDGWARIDRALVARWARTPMALLWDLSLDWWRYKGMTNRD